MQTNHESNNRRDVPAKCDAVHSSRQLTSSEMCSKSACSTICPARMDSHKDPWVASSNDAPAMCLPEPSRLSPNRWARGNLVTLRIPSMSTGCSTS